MTLPLAYGTAGAVDDVFSTTETATNRKWLGSTIYRKVIDFGVLPDTNIKSVAHGITGIDQVVHLYGWADNGAGLVFPLTNADSNAGGSVKLHIDATNVNITTGADWTGSTSHIVVEYTKT